MRRSRPLSQTKLQTDGAEHRVKILFAKRSKIPLQAALADRANLVGHRLSAVPH
jgi:hypothetical protein